MNIALIIGIPVVIVLAAVTVLASARRRSTDAQGRTTGRLGGETKASDSSALAVPDDASDDARARASETRSAAEGGVPATRGSTAVAEYTPAEYEEIQISRRQFFNRSIIATMAVSIGAFGAAAISFLYAKSAGGFGGKVDAGVGLTDAQAYFNSNKAPFYVPEARTYLQPYPTADVPRAKKVPEYAAILTGMEQGILALYQKCVHLGCRVPWCQTSQWFECPCHGSKYSRVGEKKGGPAPRGLDRFVVTASADKITIDTTIVITGPPIGTDTTSQGAEGPPCV
ncbi:MAG: Rieske 2Fe-2S domain-containing protein [Acidimicrobiia bacterium]